MTQQQTGFGQAVAPSLGSLAITVIIMFAALFWPAGRLDWPRGWMFLASSSC